MTLLGIPIKHPTPAQMVLALMFIVSTSGMAWLLVWEGTMSHQSVWPTVSGMTTGVLLSAFGVSIAEYGVRAVLVMLAVGTMVWFLIN